MSADDSVQPLREVHIDGLAVLKIIKHCNSNLPTLVSGSLLGVDVNGILEVTYSYPFPLVKAKKENSDGNNNNDDDEDKSAGANQEDGREYQTEMMKRLRDMNIDDNCVGWYQSTYLGTNHSNDVLGYQYSFQTSDELADNTAVIMYVIILSED